MHAVAVSRALLALRHGSRLQLIERFPRAFVGASHSTLKGPAGAEEESEAQKRQRLHELQGERWSDRDHVIRFHTHSMRGAVVRCGDTVAEGARRFNEVVQSSGAVGLYGKALAASVLMGSMLKGEERVSVELSVPGPRRARLYAEALAAGEVRGFAAGTLPESGLLPVDVVDEGDAGKATPVARFTHVLYNAAKPAVSTLAMQRGDVTSEVQAYYDRAAQVESLCLLHASADGGDVTAGGLLLQMMPGGDSGELASSAAALERDQHLLADAVRKGGSLDSLAKSITSLTAAEYADVARRVPLDFFCRCSKASFGASLASAGPTVLQELVEEAPTELVCQFCNERYSISEVEAQALRDGASL